MRSSKAQWTPTCSSLVSSCTGRGRWCHFAAVKMLKSIRRLSERGLLMASQDTVLSVLADFNYVSAIARSSPELRCGFSVPAFDFRWSTIGRRHVEAGDRQAARPPASSGLGEFPFRIEDRRGPSSPFLTARQGKLPPLAARNKCLARNNKSGPVQSDARLGYVR
jgi:hypothetical protein